jgi:hypothetical protein
MSLVVVNLIIDGAVEHGASRAQKAMQQNLELLQKMSPAPGDLLGSILSRFRPPTSDGEPR